MNKTKNNSELVNSRKIYLLYPDNISNKQMINILSYDKVLFVSYKEIDTILIDNKKYVNILNIGDNLNVCILLKNKVSTEKLKYICIYMAIIFSDIIIVNKVSNIEKGIFELDIALDLGKDIYAIPGEIFNYESYLANFCIKQGAMPICSKYDMEYILKEKDFNVL